MKPRAYYHPTFRGWFIMLNFCHEGPYPTWQHAMAQIWWRLADPATDGLQLARKIKATFGVPVRI